MLLLIECNKKANEPKNSIKVVEKTSKSLQKISMHKLSKLIVSGNFDGSGKIDTLFQHTFSKKTNSEIIQVPNPKENDWNLVENWFYNQEAEVFLASKFKKYNTLHLGIAQGLYCLLNIGDNNNDGKDEIALVIDKLDNSQVNTCKIYSYCGNSWIVLKQFDVFEDAFNFNGENNKPPEFNYIKGFLEKKKGKWFYKDYSQNEYDNPNDVGKLLPLQICKCDLKFK